MNSHLLLEIADYILQTERENYESFCEENELDPRMILAIEQGSHVYAKALAALGLTYKGDEHVAS